MMGRVNRGLRPFGMSVIFTAYAVCFSSAAYAQITSIQGFPSPKSDPYLSGLAYALLAGDQAYKGKDYSAAQSHWRAALNIPELNNVERSNLHIKLAKTHVLLAQYDAAAAAYQSALDLGQLSDKDRAQTIWRRDFVAQMTAPPAPHKD